MRINPMERKHLITVGAGPRALSLAIYGITHGLEITMIDPTPLRAWRYPNIIKDLVMRSPISFDLVSFLPKSEFGLWRLDEYLDCFYNYSTQREAEECDISVTREQFINYLEYCLDTLKNMGVRVIKKRVSLIGREWVRLEDGEIVRGDAVAMCIGAASKPKVPVWISSTHLYNKIVAPPNIIRNPPTNKVITIVGSGQSAAEYTALLSSSNKIYWVNNREYKVTQYPVPTYSEWGPRTALGDYYRGFYGDVSLQEAYLKRVKEWQPSITPHIDEHLKRHSHNIVNINPEFIWEMDKPLSETDYIMICTGPDSSIETIPFNEVITPLSSNPSYPLLQQGFRTPTGIYFSGLLALRYDGPRQGSIISAGLTAKEIVEDILQT